MFSWKKHFLYQVDYQYWANERLFEALAHLTSDALTQERGAQPGMLQLLRQMQLELCKWAGYLGAPLLPGEATADFRGMAQSLRQNVRGLQHWLEACSDDFFERQERYSDTHHKLHIDWTRDLLAQVLYAMAHQRGLLVAIAGSLGAPVPALDYIDYKREVQNTLDHLAGT